MAISKTFVDEDVWGKFRIKIWDITLDTSYPTGGYGASLGFSAQPLGVGLILGVSPIAWDADGPLFLLGYDRVNLKLKAFRSAAGTVIGNVTVKGGGIGEAIGINPDSNAGVLSKAAATDRTIPIATFLGAAPTVAQGSLAQVANGTNLSAITVRLLIVGR